MITIEQKIENKKAPFQDVERNVRIVDINVNLQRHEKPLKGLPQVVINYEILYTKDGIDVTKDLSKPLEPRVFNNDMKMWARSFEPETLFQPIPNPDFVEGESLESDRFVIMGAFDFVIGELAIKHGEYLFEFLKMYILDNYDDGWFDND